MSPPRNMHTIKALKVERTHEENQERAYIAASRRSDRSLEARVESARRASKIHKHRTGRSLRITEQDVLDEEMYEEEDNKLSWQYRRLTAHIQTHPDLTNAKLSTYLADQVSLESAVDQAFTNTYGHYQNVAHCMRNSQHSVFSNQTMQHCSGPVYSTCLPATPVQSFQGFDYSRTNSITPSQGVHDNSLGLSNNKAGPTPQITPSPEPSCPPTATSRLSNHPSFPPGSFACLRKTFQPQPQTQTSDPDSLPIPNTTSSHIQLQQGQQQFTIKSDINYDNTITIQNKDQLFFGPTLDPKDKVPPILGANFHHPEQNSNFTVHTHLPEAINIDKPLTVIDDQDCSPSDVDTPGPLVAEKEEYRSESDYLSQSLSSAGIGSDSSVTTPGLGGDAWTSFIDTEQWEGITAGH
ncbi:hypothetical protein B7463_g11764, partial [Scytalidium lignicola]